MHPPVRNSVRHALFVAVVVAMTLTSAVFAGIDYMLPWHPYTSFGFDSTPDGQITDIAEGMPAQKAGLRPGDRIDVSRLSLHERRFIGQLSVAPDGTTATFNVSRGGTTRPVTLTAVPRPRSTSDNATDLILVTFEIAFIVIAAVLLLSRPSVLTWSFFIFSLGPAASISFEQLKSDNTVFAIEAYGSASQLWSGAAAIVFAMLFPREVPTRREWRAIGAIALPFGAIAIVNAVSGYTAATSSVIFLPQYAVPINALNSAVGEASYISAVIIFIISYIRSSESQRKRMQWVALGFTVGTGGFELLLFLQGFLSISPPIWLLNALQCGNILVPITVSYAILKHRVIDVRFFVSRALVYGAITTLAVVTLALLEFVIARSIETRNFGVAVEVAGAVAIGLGINRLHTSIDRAVDRFVFRSVHLAEEHLRRIGAALVFAQSTDAIDRMLVEESMRALDLEQVSVVRDFDPDESIALQLHAQRAPIEDGDRLHIPIIVRHQLIGYVMYGHHRSGAAIDPNERAILADLTHHAAIAYDHAISEARISENEHLRNELTVERAKNNQLQALLSPKTAPERP